MRVLLEQIVQRLRPFGISRILVFGSAAHGEQTDDDSDIDLAVVLDTRESFGSYDERLAAKSRLRAALLDINEEVPIDILLYTEKEFQELSKETGFLASEVVEKGQTLYAKAG